jgi:hypothetical protein
MGLCNNCASAHLVFQLLSCARVPATLLGKALTEFLQDSSAVRRAQRLQCYRDGIALDVKVAGGLKDLLNELAALLFCVTVMPEDPRE